MNEADIPIDIHIAKLQDWLTSRRIVLKYNQTRIRDVRTKISSAIKDMPENEELVKLLSGAHINYFHCQRIIEILKETEKDTKSVFGIYGSQRMKEWQDILKFYEKDNVYLGEAAQILVRNLNYEIPAIKKQMTKLEQQSEDALKGINDLNKSEIILINEHALLCQQLGIKGYNLKQELIEKLKNLSQIYSESISDISSIQESVDFYSDFNKNSVCLPIFSHLIKLGNTTVYQYIHKKLPITIEESPISLNIDDVKKPSTHADSEIDFGYGDNEDKTSVEMLTFSNFANSKVQLNTGDDTIASTAVSDEIDFETPREEYGSIIEGVDMDKGKAKGDHAYTILDSPNYREKFIDELYELQSFLKLRLYELNRLQTSNNFIMLSLLYNISSHDAKSVEKMMSNLEAFMTKVLNEQIKHLFQLKHSQKYAELLTSKLKQKLSAVEKIKERRELLNNKLVELNKQKLDLKPLLDDLVGQTKMLQQQIEKDISKRYKNRVVNLIGGVNTI